MALPVVSVRSTSGAVRDVMASSVSRFDTAACSVRVCPAPGAVGSFGKTRFRDEFSSVGEPCATLRVGAGGFRVRIRAEPVGLFHPLKSNFGDSYGRSVRKRNSRIMILASSVEEGVKDSGSGETSTASSGSPKVDSPSPSTSGAKSPFKSGGKISSIAAKQITVDSKAPGSAEDASVPRKPALSIGAKQPSPVGQLSPKVAEQLKVSTPASVFTQGAGAAKPATQSVQPGGTKPASPFATGAGGTAQKPASPFAAPGAKPASPFVQPSRGKRVVDAFKEGEKEGKTTKFGQPVVPANIFQDVRRTPEEQAADAFKFSINPGQLVLIGSFLLIIGVMVGTAFLVWKLGGIHYNEY